MKTVVKIALAAILLPIAIVLLVVLVGWASPARAQTQLSCAGTDATLVVNAWSYESLSDDLRGRVGVLVASARERDTWSTRNLGAYTADDVSRTLGRRLRTEVKVRAPVDIEVTVRLRDPSTSLVVEDLGFLKLESGVGSIRLSAKQRQMVVETIWPGDVLSPTSSGGAPRLMLFPKEWGGECTMNVHGILRPKPNPKSG